MRRTAIILIAVLATACNAPTASAPPAENAGAEMGAADRAVARLVDYAVAGSPPETGNTTRRIDPAIVVADMTAAGFELEAQSDLLRNADDDYDKIVFDPALRGRTDRFVIRFRKAA